MLMNFGTMHDNNVSMFEDERKHDLTPRNSVLEPRLLLSAETHASWRTKGQRRNSRSQFLFSIIMVL